MSPGRTEPRISVNQLALYLVSGPARRRTIIECQKRPQTFQVTYYQPALDAIVPFVVNGMRDEAPLVAAIDDLYAKSPANDQEENRFESNMFAIASFLDSYKKLSLGNLRPEATRQSESRRIAIRGVQISVRPEIILCGVYRSDKRVGALKLYLSKETSLTSESASYVTCLLSIFAERFLSARGRMLPSQCQVFDVFGTGVYVARPQMTRRRRDIEAACEEIALRWPTL